MKKEEDLIFGKTEKEIKEMIENHVREIDGESCRNCSHQIKLMKHPNNTIFKGGIKEFTGLYVCDVFNCIMENCGGMCERWEDKL